MTWLLLPPELLVAAPWLHATTSIDNTPAMKTRATSFFIVFPFMFYSHVGSDHVTCRQSSVPLTTMCVEIVLLMYLHEVSLPL